MKFSKTVLSLFPIMILATVVIVVIYFYWDLRSNVSNFEECAKYFPVQETYPERCVSGNKVFVRNIPENSVTLKGEIVCLPHLNPGEVQTLECAYGLKTESGYYGLKINNIEELKMGSIVTVTGKYKSPELNEKFNISGTIEVEELSSK